MADRRKRSGRGPISWGLVVLGFVLGAAVLILVVELGPYFKPAPPQKAEVPLEKPPEEKRPELPVEGKEEKPVPQPSYPMVAIVIDDMGQDLKKLKELFQLNAPITVAVLPYLSHSADEAREAHARGMEVLLHLPMEPQDAAYNNPGKGVLLTAMSEKEVRTQVENDLASVPFASGVNNHMGSKFTESEPHMRAVLDEVKKREMYFLDSRTTPRSVGGRLARDMGMRTVDRNVFLDNTRDKAYIKDRLKEAVNIARRNGAAVAIGHPYPETIEALREAVPALQASGVRIVKLSELIEYNKKREEAKARVSVGGLTK